MKLAHIAARNVLRNRRRSILSGIAISVAAMTIVFMFSLIEGIKADMRETVFRYDSGQVRIRNTGFDENEQLNPLGFSIEDQEDLTETVAAIPGVRAVTPRITFPTAIYEKDDTYRAVGIGMDFEREKTYQDISEIVAEGKLPEAGKSEVLLGVELAGDMGVSTGDKITLFTQTRGRGSNAMTFTVSGLARFPIPVFNKTWLMAPIDRVQRLLRMDGAATEILMILDDGVPETRAVPAVNAVLEDAGRTELAAHSWKDIGQTYSLLLMAETSYQFIAVFFFLLASTVIINTTIMVIFERMREIGTVAALGMKGNEIVRLFFLEAFFIAVAGSGAGILAGSALTGILSVTGLDFGSAMEGVSFEMSSIMYPKLNLRSTLLVFVYSVAIASLASIFPSRRAARIEPVEALRSV